MNLIIKGFIIGIGKIIPGVSGSMLAITLGIYEPMIKCLSNIKLEFKNNSYFLIKVGIGILFAIILTSKVVVKCLELYYLPTMLLFIGMIVGGIPSLVKKVDLSKKDFFEGIIILFVLIMLFMVSNISVKVHVLEYSVFEFIRLIGIGIIDALSSIIPGISGTALLMIFGYYDIILGSFSTLFNYEYLFSNLFIMIPFILGFIIGVVVISKVVAYLFSYFNKMTYIVIMIFTILSIIILIRNLNCGVLEFFRFFPLLILGLFISRKLDD